MAESSNVNTLLENEKDKKKSSTLDEEEDIDALLDDALEDFDKPPPPPKREAPNKSDETKPHDGVSFDDMEGLFDEEAMSKMTEGLQEALQEMAKQDPVLMEQFNKFQSSAEGGSPGNESNDTEENIAKTMEDLSKNFQRTGEGGDLSDFMRQMEEGDGSDGFVDVMEGMMKNLLSKDLLYPSLKEISQEYPAWLVKNKTSLSAEDFDKYTKQHAVVDKICSLFEGVDTPERQMQIVDLMQQMQLYGQPPADLLENTSGDNVDAFQQPPQCSVM